MKPLRFGQLCFDQDTLYWTESRPEEKGRSVLMSTKGEVLPAPANVKSRVYEYGGGAYLIADGHLIYTDSKRVYFNDRPITTPEQGRFADFCFDASRSCIYAVREIDEVNTLARLSLDGAVEDIVTGADFYAAPRLSSDAKHLVWISWNHPNMPWDTTTLTQWDFKSPPQIIAKDASIQHPAWAKDNTLYYLTDKNGYWNFPDYPLDCDLGYPPWLLNMKRYCFHGDKIAAIATEQGTDTLIIIDPATKTHEVLDTPYTSFSEIVSDGKNLYTIAAGPTTFPALVSLLDNKIIRKSIEDTVKNPSAPVSISYGNAHMLFYPPSNKRYDKPPLILSPHSGPTAHFAPVLDLKIEHWTSRGYAFAAINYRGSSGFGKAYRNALNGQWGLLDAADCIDALDYLKDLVDPTKCVILGSSAGGFTALSAITQTNAFAAAISLYGVTDLKSLHTHKFESHYNDTLASSYAPMDHIDNIQTPMLLVQGTEDKIVPPSQSQALYDALQKRNITSEYVLIEGEGHGFRTSSGIDKAYAAQENFLNQILDLK